VYPWPRYYPGLEPAETPRPFPLILVTGLAIGIYGMQATLLGTLLPELSRTFTPAQGGSIASVQSLGLVVASFLAGPVIDRTGAKAGVLCGLGLIALSLSLLPSAHAYLPLVLTMLLLGLGGGVISTSSNTMASALGGAHGASMINLLNVFFGLGGLATPALGALLSPTVLCRVIALLAAGTLVAYALTPPLAATGRCGLSFSDGKLLLRPLFLLLAAFLFLYVAAEVGIWNWLAAYLTGKGMPEAQALHVLSFGFAAGIIAGRLIVSRVLKRFRPATVTLACSVLMAIATSAILLAPGPISAGAAVFCTGLFMAPVYPTTLSLVSEAFPRGTATAIGIAVTMGWVGVAVSSGIIGGIAGTNPNRLGFALLVIPAFAVLMCFVNLAFRPLLPRSTVAADPQ
jgi:fucose permease